MTTFIFFLIPGFIMVSLAQLSIEKFRQITKLTCIVRFFFYFLKSYLKLNCFLIQCAINKVFEYAKCCQQYSEYHEIIYLKLSIICNKLISNNYLNKVSYATLTISHIYLNINLPPRALTKHKNKVALKINMKCETLVYFYFGNHLFSSSNQAAGPRQALADSLAQRKNLNVTSILML